MKRLILATLFAVASLGALTPLGAVAAPNPNAIVPTQVVGVGLLPAAPVAITSTGTSSQAIASNPTRTGLSCTNFGSANAFLAFGTNAAISGGGVAITVGSTWWMDPLEFTTQTVNVIGVTTLACQEYN